MSSIPSGLPNASARSVHSLIQRSDACADRSLAHRMCVQCGFEDWPAAVAKWSRPSSIVAGRVRLSAGDSRARRCHVRRRSGFRMGWLRSGATCESRCRAPRRSGWPPRSGYRHPRLWPCRVPARLPRGWRFRRNGIRSARRGGIWIERKRIGHEVLRIARREIARQSAEQLKLLPFRSAGPRRHGSIQRLSADDGSS